MEVDARHDVRFLHEPYTDELQAWRREDAIGQDDGSTPTRLQELDDALNENLFGRDTPTELRGVHPPLAVLVFRPRVGQVKLFKYLLVVDGNFRSEGRIGDDDVKEVDGLVIDN